MSSHESTHGSTHEQLAAAGLQVPDDEVDGVVAWIEGSRAMAQVLHSRTTLPSPCYPDGIPGGDADE